MRFQRRLRELLAAFGDIVLPPFCALCGPRVSAGVLPALCDPCASAITLSGEPQCRVCGGALHPLLAAGERCLPCARSRPPWSSLTALAPYGGVVQTAISRLKYGREIALARPFGILLADQQRRLVRLRPADAVDVVVPVPLEKRRLRARGYNQAELLAEGLPVALDADWAPRGLTRRGDVGPQVGRPAASRRQLPAGAFEGGTRVWGRRILLVDDVVTTGATLRAAARALREAGARSVRAAVVARTPRPG